MKILCCLLIFFAFSRLSWADDRYPRNAALDVEKYVFQIDLNDQNNTIVGLATIRIKFSAAVLDFELDLANQDANGMGMEVQDVRIAGQTVNFLHENDRLKLRLPVATKPKDTLTLEIKYRGEPRSGLVIGQNKFKDRVFFADNWPNHGHQWLPSIDHPSDKAAVDFIVIAPLHYSVVANGLKIEESYLDRDRKLTHWREDVAIPVKVMVIGVARFAVQESAKLKDVAITSWVFPQNRVEGFHDYSLAVKPLAFFQENIGPYPYKKLANVQSKTRFGGLENANTIFYFEDSVNGKSKQENLIAHEVAHQWFGNSVTENDWQHVWLSEGFATYFTNLYIEANYGNERFVQQMLADRKEIISYYKKNQSPILDLQITDPQKVLSPNAYQKGGWVLHMLRQKLGNAVFWQGIREYYAKFAGKNALSKDFQIEMERVSGVDLTSFFHQNLDLAGHPNLQVEWAFDSTTNTINVRVEQMQKQAVFQFPLDLGLSYSDGQSKTETVEVRQALEVFNFKVKEIPKRLTLDPQTRLLFEGSAVQK
jgi:aminopeptidase N